MHLFYKLVEILVSVMVLATLGHGAPKGKKTSKSDNNSEHKFRETPEYLCAHVYKGFYSRYYLIGTQWPVHENLVFEGAKKAKGCHMTNWRFEEVTNPVTNGVDFNCTFDMPVLCQGKVQKSLNNYLGFHGAKDGGIFCPEVTETDALRKLFKDIGARRMSCTWYEGPGAKTCPEYRSEK